MSTLNPPVRSRRSRLLAFATAVLVAAGGLVLAPAAANAAPVTVTSATLNWGFKESWRNYITNVGGSQGSFTELSGGASTDPAPYNWGQTSSGSFDSDTGQGSFTVPGSVRWGGFHGIDITVASPTVSFDLAAGSGTITAGGETIATFSTSGASVSHASGVLSVSGAAATATAGTEAVFGASYQAGTSLDPVSFRVGYALPAAATTTTLAPSATSIEVGETVEVTATVAPAAAGSVEFFNGSASLGTSAVSGGTATLAVAGLAAGTHSVRAVFTSSDSAFLGSESATVDITVTVPVTAEATTTTIADPAPAGPVVLGTPVTLSATVAAADAAIAGSVEFFSVAAGTTTRTSLGSVAVDAGVAEITTSTLAAGGHTFVAVFTPTDATALQSSEAATTANYGVVDTAAPAPYTPGAGATTTSGATASWDWSAYSAGWAKAASGNATVDGQTFRLTDGEVTADAGGAVVRFDATLRTTAYGIAVVELTDPALHIDASGAGVWVANVNGSADRIVVGTFSGVDAQVGQDTTRTVAFDWGNATAPGTWYVFGDTARTESWPNAFVLLVPSSIQSFYYMTTASAAQATKPASPLSVTFDWPAVSETSLAATPAAPVVLGGDVTLTATVTPAGAAGTVEFFDTAAATGAERSLGTASVSDGVATFTTNTLVAGGHTFRAVFTSTNGFDGSDAALTTNFGVVDVAQPVVCTPAAGASETVTGVNAAWDFSAYSAGWDKSATGNVTVDGQTFRLAGGTATVSDDCVKIAFTGSLSILAYGAYGVTLTNPVLTVDKDGNGAWSAAVSSVNEGVVTPAGAPIVVAAVQGAAFPAFTGVSMNAEVALAYAGTTAPGTWYVHADEPRTDAWGNAFVMAVPSGIRSFFYQTTASAAQATKPPAPIALDWSIAALSGTVNGQVSDARVLQGQTVTFTGGPFRWGEVVSFVVNSAPVTLPAVTVGLDGVASQTWTVPADFAPGAHTVTISAGDRTLSLPFTVEKVEVPVTTTPTTPEEVCVARAVTGGSMNWEFKQSFKSYIQGPIAKGAFSGGSFSATGGSVNVDAGGIGVVNFRGSIVATGHDGTMDVRISNPRIQITGARSGVMYGTLTESGSGGYVAIANLSFSSISTSGGTLRATGSSATLTGAAAAAFGGFYGAGTALDAVSFQVSLGGEVACTTATNPKGGLAATGSEAGAMAPFLTFGAFAMLLGLALVRIRRRQEA